MAAEDRCLTDSGRIWNFFKGWDYNADFFMGIKTLMLVLQLFPQIDNIMVEPLRVARDRYEGMKEQVSTSPNTNEVKVFQLASKSFLFIFSFP